MTKTTTMAAPRTSALDPAVAITLAADAYERFTALLRDLDPGDWTRPTECSSWDVQAMAGHLLGMMEMVTSPEENVRQGRAAAEVLSQRGGKFIDALTAVQVAEHRHLGPAEIIDGLTRTAPKAVRGRQYTPDPIKQNPMPNKQLVGGQEEEWTVGYLLDTILTRDPWMHRIDICRAVGSERFVDG